jgi:hypothetical protein
MKGQSNTTAIIGIIVIVLVAIGGWWYFTRSSADNLPGETASGETEAVQSIVTSFGSQMKNVPLTASSTAIASAVAQYYGPYVAPELLAQWESAPTTSPGRLTSSPWPDRIEITSVAKNEDGSYSVVGNVIEVTSVEETEGGVADSYPVSFTVENQNGAWLIARFMRAPTE